MRFKIKTRLVCVCVLSVGWANWALADGEITGTVSDFKGNPIDRAEVRVCNEDTLIKKTISATDGTYSFKDLDPGTYRLEASHPGYHREEIGPIEIPRDSGRAFDFCLQRRAEQVSRFDFQFAAPRVHLCAGYAVPISPSDFVDGWNTGFLGGIRFGFSATPLVTILMGVDYNYFGTSSTLETDGGAVTIVYVTGNVRLELEELFEVPLTAFLLGGLGYHYKRTDEIIDSNENSSLTIPTQNENNIGFNVGGGIEINQFLIEAIYVVGLTEGGSIGHFNLRAGISIGLDSD